jgi:hypothetical protein
MGRQIGMNPEAVRGTARDLAAQHARLDRLITKLGTLHRAAVSPDSFGIEPGSPTVAPWSVGEIAKARTQLISARSHVDALLSRLLDEVGGQEDVSKSGASVSVASLASHKTSTKKPDDVDDDAPPPVFVGTADSWERRIQKYLDDNPSYIDLPGGRRWDVSTPYKYDDIDAEIEALRDLFEKEITKIETEDSWLDNFINGTLDDSIEDITGERELSPEQKIQIEIWKTLIEMLDDPEGRIIVGYLFGISDDLMTYGNDSGLVRDIRTMDEVAAANAELARLLKNGGGVGTSVDANYDATFEDDIPRDIWNYLNWSSASPGDRVKAALGTFDLNGTITSIDYENRTAIVTYSGYNSTTAGSLAGFRLEEWTKFLNETAESTGILSKKEQYFGWQEVIYF